MLRLPIGKSIYSENLAIEKDNDFYGVFEEEQLIGTLSYYEEKPQAAHLTAFAVKSSHQRTGIGKKLIEMLIKDLKSKGYEEIRVDAREEAVSFYKKCKFEIVSGPVINEILGVIDFKMVCHI
ncbi:GNAT family N-acetyltransferase [uncultured Vagococcus sp.]|uniref:GNAT family N-acetyltransferase n=1 Tax=uncultured Vagococcus sp. TaxID=189676 RepID=UPI0028D7EA96|nr:GNAT family N-acetyltransferase [uncultured Vagococcus sp.]